MTRIVVLFSLAAVIATAAPAGAQEPPEVAVVVRVTGPPLLTLTGRPDEAAAPFLRELRTALGRLAKVDLPYALAPSPLFLDELGSLRTPASSGVLSAIRTLASTRDVLASPYADVRLTELDDHALRRELRSGVQVLRRVLRRTSPVLFAPGLAVDYDTAREVRRMGFTAMLAPTTTGEAVPGLIGSVVLEDPHAPPPAAVVSVVEPSGAAGLAKGSKVIPLAELEAAARGAAAPDATRRRPRTYRRMLSRAERAVSLFSRYAVAPGARATAFRFALAHARSTNEPVGWRTLTRRADELRRTVVAERKKVTIALGPVTFTSRRGSVPVTVTNAATYRVKLRVRASSPKLDFVGGGNKIVDVAPPGDTITFDAVAKSTGSFPMRIEVTSPGGAIHFDDGVVTVRSTGANVAALVLTLSGGAFLLFWYARRLAARRRHPSSR